MGRGQQPVRKAARARAVAAAPAAPRGQTAGGFNRDQNIGYLLRDAARLLLRALQQRLTGAGLTLGNWFILRELWETDGLTLRELGVRLDLLGPSVVAAIDSMEKRKLVERRRSANDRRQVHIFLTDKGKQLQVSLQSLPRSVSAIGFRGIDDGSLEALRVMLRTVRDNYRADAGRNREIDAAPRDRTATEKADIILEVLRGEISVAEASVKYAFSPAEYQQWTKAYHQAGKGALVTTRKPARKKSRSTR